MNVEHRVPRKRNKGTSTQARHLLASQQPFRDSLAVELLAGVQRAFRVSTLAALRKNGGMATSLRCARGRSALVTYLRCPRGRGPAQPRPPPRHGEKPFFVPRSSAARRIAVRTGFASCSSLSSLLSDGTLPLPTPAAEEDMIPFSTSAMDQILAREPKMAISGPFPGIFRRKNPVSSRSCTGCSKCSKYRQFG